MTAPEQPDPDRPTAADQGALFDAVGAEHAAIYGYGMVSAHSLPIRNDLVSAVLADLKTGVRHGGSDHRRAGYAIGW